MKNKKKLKNRKSGSISTPRLVAAVILIIFALYAGKLYREERSVTVSSEADGVLYAHFIDVGQGDAALITLPGGENILIDAGTRKNGAALCSYLNEAGVDSIDVMILSHPHEDHIGGAPAVLDAFTVDKVIMPDVTAQTSIFRTTLEAIADEGCDTEIAKPDGTLTAGGSVFTFLGPITCDEEELNNSSIVAKLTYGDTSFMFTGDAESDEEWEILGTYRTEALDSDVLKVGHHGSSTSTSKAFFRAVSPSIAVISCGQANDYGHPHSETLDLLEKEGTEYYRTDRDSTVIIASDGSTVTAVE